jgi:alpha-L-arabinofuranosidase
VVTCTDNRKDFSVALINKHPEKEVRFAVNIAGISERISAVVLEGDSPDAYNDVEDPDRVIPQEVMVEVEDNSVLLLPHSVNIVRFSVP